MIEVELKSLLLLEYIENVIVTCRWYCFGFKLCFLLVSSVKAKQNLQAYTIELKIDLSINSSFNLNAASTYHMLEAAAKTTVSTRIQFLHIIKSV